MNVELVLPAARPEVRVLAVAEGCRAQEVLRQAGYCLPEKYGLSVFGRAVSADTVLREGDRLEVCPPLAMSPAEARRRRMAGSRA